MNAGEFLSKFAPICFYHFTDTRNLDSIRASGGLHCLRVLRERGVEIPAAGGNDWSHEADEARGLDDFVHLCLRNQHPMEYVARKDGRIIASKYLRIDPRIVSVDGIRFTEDVSNKAGVPLLTLAEAAERLDFEVIYSWTDWRKPEIQKRLRQAAKYELLIPERIQLDSILNI